MMQRITVAFGDGIGPEIMRATLEILEAADVPLAYDVIEIGAKAYEQGYDNGIPPEAWETLYKNPVILKAPIRTPQGGGYKSLNVTIRKRLGLFANVRPCRALTPFVHSQFPNMDIVIVRENEEDLYTGIEYQQSAQVVQALKVVSVPGSEAIIRFAFEYARLYGRKKVTCMTKDNIMKQTDGLFHKLFERIAKDYPEIEHEHKIIDIGSAFVAARPYDLDVVVTLNLYGDIISDIAALVAGSVGLSGSANIGRTHAMFEAIHGTAPDIAGKGIANPSGLLNAAIMMLVHLGLTQHATLIHNAWLKTIEDGIHTGDIYRTHQSKRLVGTAEFAQAVIERLGEEPKQLKAVRYEKTTPIQLPQPVYEPVQKTLVGVDVFISKYTTAEQLAEQIQQSNPPIPLKLIANRGMQVYPDSSTTFCTDLWHCRFVKTPEQVVDHQTVITLLQQLAEQSLDFVKIEHLYYINGKRAYALVQGEKEEDFFAVADKMPHP